MPHTVTIKQRRSLATDVLELTTTRPDGYTFEPGQATHVNIVDNEWRDQERPFTFTSRPRDPFLQFTIKIYPERDGVTDAVSALDEGDRLAIDQPFGNITFRGPGLFIAGGAGITPFLSIFRELEARSQLSGNRLIFANDREQDIIACDELKTLLGDAATFLVTEESSSIYSNRQIDAGLLREHVRHDSDEPVYVCGPPEMVSLVTAHLHGMGVPADRIVIED